MKNNTYKEMDAATLAGAWTLSSATLKTQILGGTAGWGFNGPIVDKILLEGKLRSRETIGLYMPNPEFCEQLVEDQPTVGPADLRPMARFTCGSAVTLHFPVTSELPSIIFDITYDGAVIKEVVISPSRGSEDFMDADVAKFTVVPGRAVKPEGRVGWFVRLIAALGKYIEVNKASADKVYEGPPSDLVLTGYNGGAEEASRSLGGRRFTVTAPHTRRGHTRVLRSPYFKNARFTEVRVRPCRVNAGSMTLTLA